jgi:hypothetical protein
LFCFKHLFEFHVFERISSVDVLNNARNIQIYFVHNLNIGII